MSELPCGLSMEDSCEESAADTLSLIVSLGKRARNLQQRVWLLPVALGVTTILGTTLLSATPRVSSCSEMTVTHRVVSCSIGHAGTGLTVATQQAGSIRGPVAISLGATSPVLWSIGNSPWFWLIGIAASVLLSVLCQRSFSRLRAFTVTYLLAGLIGVFVLLGSTQLNLPSRVSHLLAISLIICIAGFAARSQALALVAALSFFIGLAVSRQSADLFAQLNILIPPRSVAYLMAGLVLIIGSGTIYWLRSSARVGIGRLQQSGTR